MPLLNPFNIPEPIEEPLKGLISKEQYEYIINYLNIDNWKCPNCGSTVFGRTLICPFNQNGIYCKTGRPEGYDIK